MSNIFNTVFQTIKAELPNINWSLGSVVRTLVVDPLAHISDALDSVKAEQAVYNELDVALASPADYEDVLDVWMTRLNIDTPTDTRSTGTVVIARSNAESMTIAAGTVFQWGSEIQLVADSTTTWGMGIEPLKYKTEIPAALYIAEVPVTASTQIPVTLSSGSPINWAGASNDILDVYIGKPVSGGVYLTAESKANLISAHLASPSVCGSDGIRSSLLRKYPTRIVDAQVGDRQARHGCVEVPVYVKQVNLPDISASDDTSTDAKEAIAWLNSKQVGSPFQMVGKSPVYVSLKLIIPIGLSNPGTRTLAELVSYINQSRLNATISDSNISALLAKYGLSLNSQITYCATVLQDTGSYTVTRTGAISLLGLTGTNNAPYALYCDMDSITTY